MSDDLGLTVQKRGGNKWYNIRRNTVTEAPEEHRVVGKWENT